MISIQACVPPPLMVVAALAALVLVRECLATAVFQVDVAGLMNRNAPLGSIIDYRHTDLETVRNVQFKYYDR